jgi:hypothetical protein
MTDIKLHFNNMGWSTVRFIFYRYIQFHCTSKYDNSHIFGAYIGLFVLARVIVSVHVLIMMYYNKAREEFIAWHGLLYLHRSILFLFHLFLLHSPQPPHAHVRLSLGQEPASTELGGGERDACPPIRVCLCLGALLRCGIARYTYIQISFLSSAVTRR